MTSTPSTTTTDRRAPRIPALVTSILIVGLVAALGGLASADAAGVYGQLEQPTWAPPSWLFGPAWTVL